MFDWKKPTVQMLGRWQPWHDGHTELFKRALQKTGQVCIMYRDVGGVDAGVEGQADNPFQFEEVKAKINELINADPKTIILSKLFFILTGKLIFPFMYCNSLVLDL